MTHAAVADPVSEYVSGHDFRMLVGGDLVAAASGNDARHLQPVHG